MGWLVPQVEIAFLIQVGKKILPVVGSWLAIFFEGVCQCDDSVAQVLAHHRSTENPSKEIAKLEVVTISL